MNKTITGLLVAAVLLTAAVGVTFPKADVASRGETGARGEQGPAGQAGAQGAQGPRGATGSSADLSGLSSALSSLQSLVAGLKNQPTKLSGFPGPDLNTPYLSVNGVTTWYRRTTMGGSLTARVSSTTLCALPSAPSATSTLSVRVQVTRSTTTATYLVLEKRQKPYAPPLGAATSGPGVVLGAYLLPANTTGTWVVQATTTSLTTDGQTEYPTIFGAQEGASSTPFFVAHLKNAGGGGLTANGTGELVAGSCSAEFKEF